MIISIKISSENEIITYKNINDLNKKILFYKTNINLTKKIAMNGRKKLINYLTIK